MARVMKPQVLALVAARFKILSDAARLSILQALQQEEEKTVSQLVEDTGLGQTTVSKHLQLLLAHGFVRRRREGLYAHYSLADADVLKLCDIMCAHLEAEADVRRKLVAAGGRR